MCIPLVLQLLCIRKSQLLCLFLAVPASPVVTPVGSSSLVEIATRDIISGIAVLAFEVSSALPPVRPQDLTWSFTSDGGGADVLLDYQVNLPRHSFSSGRLNLSIANLSVGDAGLYCLTATNLAGSNSSTILLTVFGQCTRTYNIIMP